MERSIIATSERYYQGYTYQRITKVRSTGGKLEDSITEYENCPLVWANTKRRVKSTQDGLYSEGTSIAHIPERFFYVNEFTPSMNDRIVKDDIIYRIVDLKDYTFHPHINVWSVSLRRIEYRG